MFICFKCYHRCGLMSVYYVSMCHFLVKIFSKYRYLAVILCALLSVQIYLIFSVLNEDIHPFDTTAIFSDEKGVQLSYTANEDRVATIADEIDRALERGQHTHWTAVQLRKWYQNPERVSPQRLGFQPGCQLNSSRALLSALSRAETQQCRRQLADFHCSLRAGTVYPRSLPNLCPSHEHEADRHLGCFGDRRLARVLPHFAGRVKSPDQCVSICVRRAVVYAGLQYGGECWCGDKAPDAQQALPAAACNLTCSNIDATAASVKKSDASVESYAASGGENSTCGGYLTFDLYETGLSAVHPLKAVSAKSLRASDGRTEPAVRIAFVLTLNGRDVRQVRRLLNMIYDRRHFYLLHVDARQNYLYSQLLPLETHTANIRLLRQRERAIWGGASLLRVIMTSLRHLTQPTNPPWDYVLNLSESDLPVKRLDALTAFLGANLGSNFLKSHGQTLERFVSKQGFNHSFYECEGRLWRVGERALPRAPIDGGSDWVCLHRDFVQFVVDSASGSAKAARTEGENSERRKGEESLVTSALRVFNHSLLPVESFFHVVLRSSPYCGTRVNNNLRLTNWQRSRGCHCQHRHVVDWCGCSPNNFVPTDTARLRRTASSDLFFARKFEPMVSVRAINELDEWLHGERSQSGVSFHRHWLNLYDRSTDAPSDTLTDDAHATLYRSLTRLAVRQIRDGRVDQDKSTRCLSELPHASTDGPDAPAMVQSVHALRQPDGEAVSLWLVVRLSVASRQFEALVRPPATELSRSPAVGGSTARRLASIRIGSDYDQKEEVFRNWAGSLGPFSTPVVLHQWLALPSVNASNSSSSPTTTTAVNVSLVVVDPAGIVARVDRLRLNASVNTGLSRVAVRQPMRPGVWTVRVYEEVPGRRPRWLASADFTVLPLDYWRDSPLNQSLTSRLHNGPSVSGTNTATDDSVKQAGVYTDESPVQIDFYQRLVGVVTTGKLSEATSKAALVEQDLRMWVDKLVEGSYIIENLCLATDDVEDCVLPQCRQTDWSSEAPDPKSHFDALDENSPRV